jgi:hypothetical protein
MGRAAVEGMDAGAGSVLPCKESAARKCRRELLKDADGAHPGGGERRPMGDRQGLRAGRVNVIDINGLVDGTESVSVAAVGKDVHLRGNAGVLEQKEVVDGVFDVDGVVLSLYEEGWRGVGGDVKVGSCFVEVVRLGDVGGIDEHGEIGAAA